MSKQKKGRIEAARVIGIRSRLDFPVGRLDLRYVIVNDNGEAGAEEHLLQVVTTAEEARRIAGAVFDLARALEALAAAES